MELICLLMDKMFSERSCFHQKNVIAQTPCCVFEFLDVSFSGAALLVYMQGFRFPNYLSDVMDLLVDPVRASSGFVEAQFLLPGALPGTTYPAVVLNAKTALTAATG